MSFDKSRFTTNPQHDSEGFTTGDCMPWCEPCGSYHHADAPGCFKARPSVWSQISDEDLERVHDYWTRQAVLS